MPRPGSRSARSGTISLSGPTTKRISPDFGPLSRVTMHRRSGSLHNLSRPPRPTLVSGHPARCLVGLRTVAVDRNFAFAFALFALGCLIFVGTHQLGRVDPAEQDARRHDQMLGLGEAHLELLE